MAGRATRQPRRGRWRTVLAGAILLTVPPDPDPFRAAPARDATTRFSARVDDYARYRPRYPEALYAFLREEPGVGPGSVVADVGCGTGIFAQPLLAAGAALYGVEPNAAMRAAAERLLSSYPAFRSVDGSAEATTLPHRSVDLVTCAQAFHWVDGPRAAAEFRRIARPGGAVAVVWNERHTTGSPFLADYENLLLTCGTDYRQVAREHRPMKENDFSRLFGASFRRASFPNAQSMDFDGLRGRLASASYTPAPGAPGHAEMLDALRRIFDRHQSGGKVTLTYNTDLYFATLP